MIGAVGSYISQNVAAEAAAQASAPAPSAAVSAASLPAPSFVSAFNNLLIRVDNVQDAVIIEFRSGKTGEVTQQYPTQAQIEAFHQAQSLETRQAVPASGEKVDVSVPSATETTSAVPSAPSNAPVDGGGHSVVV